MLVSIKADPHVFSAPTVGSTDTLARQHHFSYIAVGIASQLDFLCFFFTSRVPLFLSLSLLFKTPAARSLFSNFARHRALFLLLGPIRSSEDAFLFSSSLCAADRRPSRGLSHCQGTSCGQGHQNRPKVLHYQHGMRTPRRPAQLPQTEKLTILYSSALRQISGMRTYLAVAWATFWLSTSLLPACLCCSPMCTAQRIIKFARSLPVSRRSMLPAPSPRWSCPTNLISRPRIS